MTTSLVLRVILLSGPGFDFKHLQLIIVFNICYLPFLHSNIKKMARPFLYVLLSCVHYSKCCHFVRDIGASQLVTCTYFQVNKSKYDNVSESEDRSL